MSEHTDTGGDAFPSDVSHGMTLRDYFAATVLSTRKWSEDEDEGSAEIAGWCYYMADAMLEARNS